MDDFKDQEAKFGSLSLGNGPTAKPTSGGLGGFIQRNLPTIGSVALPALADVATGGLALPFNIALGAAGGGLGKVGQNALEHKSLTGGVAGQTALGGAGEFGGQFLGKTLGKVAGVVKKPVENGLAKVADNKAQQGIAEDAIKNYQEMAPYNNIPTGKRQDVNMNGVIDHFKSLGLGTDPRSLANAASVVTGSEGAVSGTMRELAQNHPNPINVNGFMGHIEKAINENSPILGEAKTAGKGNSLYKNYMAVLQQKLQEGQGSLTGEAPADRVFSTIQDIDKQIARYGKSAPGTEGEAIADVAKQAKSFLEDKLYNDSSFNKTVAHYKLAPEDEQTIKDIVSGKGAKGTRNGESMGSPQLADHIISGINDATSGQQLRTLQKPFVDASKLSHEAQVAAGGILPAKPNLTAAGGAGGNSRSSLYTGIELSRLLHGDPTMLLPLAGSLGNKTGTEAGGLLKTGEKVVNTGNKVNSVIPGPGGATTFLSRLAAQDVAHAGNNQSDQTSPADSSTPPPAPSANFSNLLSSGTQPSASTDTSSEDDNSPFSQASIQKAILSDIQSTGGKNISTLVNLYNTFGKAAATASASSKPNLQQSSLAQSGLSSLNSLAGMIDQDPSVVTKSATPGQSLPIVGGYIASKSGASGYESELGNIVDVLSKLRTGKAATKAEQQLYKQQLPRAGDSPDVVAQKLLTVQQAFAPFINPGS